MTEHEEWRPVVGFEGYYEVSDQGRVRSIDRTVTDSLGRRFLRHGRVLSPAAERTTVPYFKVVLYRGARATTVRAHVLVAAAFIGARPPGSEVCHNDGDPQNNRPSNLRYDTPTGNQRDRVRHGTHLSAHCINGHLRTPGNLSPAGRCLICRRATDARLRARRKRSQP